jgi:hypothetical protein
MNNELNNPLFEDKKEFLERQKQEYKNALMGDVADLKNQSQKIGKNLLLAGGALAGVWLITKMFGGGKKKSKTLKAGNPKQLLARNLVSAPAHGHPTSYPVVNEDGSINYESAIHTPHTPPAASHYQEPRHAQPSVLGELAKTFMESEMARALSTQVTAFLLIFITKKLEDYLQVHKNADIVVPKEPETRDIEFSYHDEDAV